MWKIINKWEKKKKKEEMREMREMRGAIKECRGGDGFGQERCK